ncbi:MAG: hypothetical protein WAZ22_06625 [Mesotoga infera]|uniref:hypothetical protein n=1 Tax=Mesotoga infera TaxID=1236046 RepID=UPI001E3DBA93|nr:hypothetical protein [Mesotoga infera]HOI35492.1 hypothetical protein [Mesotoga infera]
MSSLVDVNLYSKKKRVCRLRNALIILLLIVVLVVGARFLASQAFEFRLRQISRLKGFLFDNTGTYLTGNLRQDIQTIRDKKQEYINSKNRLSMQVRDLRTHVQRKSLEMNVFRTLNTFLNDENAVKTILTRVNFENGKGNAFYYLIYDGNKVSFPTPSSTPVLLSTPNVRGNLEFADLYTLQIIDLEVGDKQ